MELNKIDVLTFIPKYTLQIMAFHHNRPLYSTVLINRTASRHLLTNNQAQEQKKKIASNLGKLNKRGFTSCNLQEMEGAAVDFAATEL